MVAAFAYDGDGGRVKASFGSGTRAVITAYVAACTNRPRADQESFNDGLAQGWTAASGTWAVTSSRYRQSANHEQHQRLPGDAAERAAVLSLGGNVHQW